MSAAGRSCSAESWPTPNSTYPTVPSTARQLQNGRGGIKSVAAPGLMKSLRLVQGLRHWPRQVRNHRLPERPRGQPVDLGGRRAHAGQQARQQNMPDFDGDQRQANTPIQKKFTYMFEMCHALRAWVDTELERVEKGGRVSRLSSAKRTSDAACMDKQMGIARKQKKSKFGGVGSFPLELLHGAPAGPAVFCDKPPDLVPRAASFVPLSMVGELMALKEGVNDVSISQLVAPFLSAQDCSNQIAAPLARTGMELLGCRLPPRGGGRRHVCLDPRWPRVPPLPPLPTSSRAFMHRDDVFSLGKPVSLG